MKTILILMLLALVYPTSAQQTDSTTDSTFALVNCTFATHDWIMQKMVEYFAGEWTHDEIMRYVEHYFSCN